MLLRQIHLYLGCFFAPMTLYFSLSGVWQVFRFNDLPKPPKNNPVQALEIEIINRDEGKADSPTIQIRLRSLLNELSKPHKSSTSPGADPRKEHSWGFDWLAAAMGFGLFSTTLLGIALAWQVPKRRRKVVGSLFIGLILPVLFLVLGQV